MQRATRIKKLARDVLMVMELVGAQGTIADRLAAVELVVELINKCLYSFTLSQEMLDVVDDILNVPYQNIEPTPESITRVFDVAVRALRRFEQHVDRWL